MLVGTILILYFAWAPTHQRLWSWTWFGAVTGDGWFNATRSAVTALGAIGIGGAAYIAYRRQHSNEAERDDALDRDALTKRETELAEQRDRRDADLAKAQDQRAVERDLHNRFTDGAKQLGDDKPSIRLAGVYALAALADDWLKIENPGQAQAVVNVLTAYLRTDVVPATTLGSATKAERATAGKLNDAEREVRKSIIGVIREKRSTTLDELSWNYLHLDLVGADLSGAILTLADLRGANLTGVNLSDADLTGVNLSGAPLAGVNLSDARLGGANLSGAILTRADLSGATLNYADLSKADLRSANFTRAQLLDANLTLADLRRANLSDAALYPPTECSGEAELAGDPTTPLE